MNFYDYEEQALRRALAESLAEELIPPNERIHPVVQPGLNSRGSSNPISERAEHIIEICEESQKKIRELLAINISSNLVTSQVVDQSKEKTLSKESEDNLEIDSELNSTQKIRKEQDDEYFAFLHEMEKDQCESSADTIQNHENIEISEGPSSVHITQLEDVELPPEPEDGIVIAVIFPDRSRLTRKFSLSSNAIEVYTWCHSQPQLSNQKISDYEILLPTGTLLDPHMTLESQNINNRTLFNIRMK